MNLTSSPHDHVVFPKALQHCGLLLHVDFCHNSCFISSVPVTAIVNGDLPDVTGKSCILNRNLTLVDCGSMFLTQKLWWCCLLLGCSTHQRKLFWAKDRQFLQGEKYPSKQIKNKTNLDPQLSLGRLHTPLGFSFFHLIMHVNPTLLHTSASLDWTMSVFFVLY